MIFFLIAIVLIFMSAIKDDAGDSYLDIALDSLSGGAGADTTVTASVIFLVIAIVAIIIVTRKPGGKSNT